MTQEVWGKMCSLCCEEGTEAEIFVSSFYSLLCSISSLAKNHIICSHHFHTSIDGLTHIATSLCIKDRGGWGCKHISSQLWSQQVILKGSPTVQKQSFQPKGTVVKEWVSCNYKCGPAGTFGDRWHCGRDGWVCGFWWRVSDMVRYMVQTGFSQTVSTGGNHAMKLSGTCLSGHVAFVNAWTFGCMQYIQIWIRATLNKNQRISTLLVRFIFNFYNFVGNSKVSYVAYIPQGPRD